MSENLYDGEFGGVFSGRVNKFADPFLLPSTWSMPQTLETGLDLGLFLYYMNPQYRRAIQRVIAHFCTRIDVVGTQGDAKEQSDLIEYLEDGLDIFGSMQALGEEYGAYGNGFLRISLPFDRFLVDNRGGKLKLYALGTFNNDIKYNFNELTYTVPDPTKLDSRGRTTTTINLPFLDKPSQDINRISLRLLDPRRVDLRHSWISGKTQYVYRFEEWFAKAIKDSFLWQVNETPMAMLQAIKNDQDFLFGEDEVFHFKAPTLSGISNNGWGLPETLANYRALHQVQVYRKIDEAVGLDYMLPFRLFMPEIGDSPAGLPEYHDLQQWKMFMHEIIHERRRNPFAIHTLPLPTKYMEAGNTGKMVTPWENMQYADKNLMEAMGVPAELWQGSLNIQEIPTTLRLFENTFHFIYRNNKALLKWVTRKVLEYQGREQIKVTLQLPSMAADMEERQVLLQLAASGEISRRKAYRWLGVDDPIQEIKDRGEEDIEAQKVRQKLQDDYQRQQQQGSMSQIAEGEAQQDQAAQQSQGSGGAGGAPGGTPTTPLDINDKAQDEAQRLLQIPSNGDRAKELEKLKATDQNLYYAVSGKMEEMRRQGASQGRASVGQQLQQQQQ